MAGQQTKASLSLASLVDRLCRVDYPGYVEKRSLRRVALRGGCGLVLTYRDLHQLIGYAALHLQRFDNVYLCMRPSPEAVVIVAALWKLGKTPTLVERHTGSVSACENLNLGPQDLVVERWSDALPDTIEDALKHEESFEWNNPQEQEGDNPIALEFLGEDGIALKTSDLVQYVDAYWRKFAGSILMLKPVHHIDFWEQVLAALFNGSQVFLPASSWCDNLVDMLNPCRSHPIDFLFLTSRQISSLFTFFRIFNKDTQMRSPKFQEGVVCSTYFTPPRRGLLEVALVGRHLNAKTIILQRNPSTLKVEVLTDACGTLFESPCDFSTSNTIPEDEFENTADSNRPAKSLTSAATSGSASGNTGVTAVMKRVATLPLHTRTLLDTIAPPTANRVRSIIAEALGHNEVAVFAENFQGSLVCFYRQYEISWPMLFAGTYKKIRNVEDVPKFFPVLPDEAWDPERYFRFYWECKTLFLKRRMLGGLLERVRILLTLQLLNPDLLAGWSATDSMLDMRLQVFPQCAIVESRLNQLGFFCENIEDRLAQEPTVEIFMEGLLWRRTRSPNVMPMSLHTIDASVSAEECAKIIASAFSTKNWLDKCVSKDSQRSTYEEHIKMNRSLWDEILKTGLSTVVKNPETNEILAVMTATAFGSHQFDNLSDFFLPVLDLHNHLDEKFRTAFQDKRLVYIFQAATSAYLNHSENILAFKMLTDGVLQRAANHPENFHGVLVHASHIYTQAVMECFEDFSCIAEIDAHDYLYKNEFVFASCPRNFRMTSLLFTFADWPQTQNPVKEPK